MAFGRRLSGVCPGLGADVKCLYKKVLHSHLPPPHPTHPSRLTDAINMQHSTPEPRTLTRGPPPPSPPPTCTSQAAASIFPHEVTRYRPSRRGICMPFCQDDPSFNPEESWARQISIHLVKHACKHTACPHTSTHNDDSAARAVNAAEGSHTPSTCSPHTRVDSPFP